MPSDALRIMSEFLESPLLANKVLALIAVGLLGLWALLALTGLWRWNEKTQQSLGRLTGTSFLIVSIGAALLIWPTEFPGQLVLASSTVLGTVLVAAPKKALPLLATGAVLVAAACGAGAIAW